MGGRGNGALELGDQKMWIPLEVGATKNKAKRGQFEHLGGRTKFRTLPRGGLEKFRRIHHPPSPLREPPTKNKDHSLKV